MWSNWVETIGSINGYVDGLKKNKIEGTITIIAFDDAEPALVIRKVSIPYWETLSPEVVSPRGGTPLYDALGNALRMASEANSEKVAVVVVTDGAENSSKEFNLASVKAAIDACTKKGWEVLFLSADLNFNANQYTQAFGLAASKFVNTSNITRGATMSSLAAKTAMYTQTDDMTVAAAAMTFTVEEQAAAEEK
jgi:hypothetical protein